VDDELLWSAVQKRVAAKVSKNKMPDVVTFVQVPYSVLICMSVGCFSFLGSSY